MLPYRPSALLASAALALGAALVPGGAFADTTAPAPAPTFTAADLVAALTAAEVPTAAAAQAGWIARGTDTESGAAPEAMTAIYAIDRGAATAGSELSMVEADHAGTYLSLSSFGMQLASKRALKAVRKPHAAWVFMPDRSLDLRDVDTDSAIAHLAPDLLLAQLVDPTRTTLTGTPTETVATDGSTTYAFADTDLTAGGESGTMSVTIDASGIVTALTSATDAESDTARYTYGTQHVALPAKRHTVGIQRLTEGMFLATLPQQLRMAATQIATSATHLARHSRHHVVAVPALRTRALRFANVSNGVIGARVFGTRPIPGGVRITGTNRYTHRHVAYTVTTAGSRAIARRA